MRCAARNPAPCPQDALTTDVPVVIEGFEEGDLEVEIPLCGFHATEVGRITGDISLSHAMRSGWTPEPE